MSWLDTLRDRATEARREPLPPARTRDAVVVEKPKREPKPEIKSFWVQVAAPRDGDLGCVEAAYYSVADGMLTMHDANGKPGKEYRLHAGEDPRRAAGRLAREAWFKEIGASDFNRSLTYEPLGIA
jgi:hypothetical protein